MNSKCGVHSCDTAFRKQNVLVAGTRTAGHRKQPTTLIDPRASTTMPESSWPYITFPHAPQISQSKQTFDVNCLVAKQRCKTATINFDESNLNNVSCGVKNIIINYHHKHKTIYQLTKYESID